MGLQAMGLSPSSLLQTWLLLAPPGSGPWAQEVGADLDKGLHGQCFSGPLLWSAEMAMSQSCHHVIPHYNFLTFPTDNAQKIPVSPA